MSPFWKGFRRGYIQAHVAAYAVGLTVYYVVHLYGGLWV